LFFSAFGAERRETGTQHRNLLGTLLPSQGRCTGFAAGFLPTWTQLPSYDLRPFTAEVASWDFVDEPRAIAKNQRALPKTVEQLRWLKF